MPLGPGNEHLPERVLRMFEREIERRLERRAQVPHGRVAVLTRAVQVEAALLDPDLPREERKRLRAELQELRQDAEDLKREEERLSENIETAKREFRAAVAAEGHVVLPRLVGEMDAIVDLAGTVPMEDWARAHVGAAALISALAQRWLNSMGESTNTTKGVGGFPLYARIPMWSRPSEARAEDLIAWTVKSVRYRQRLVQTAGGVN